MLSRDSLASGLLDPFLGDITKRNHTDGLPDTKTDTWNNTTVEAANTAGLVDVAESVAARMNG